MSRGLPSPLDCQNKSSLVPLSSPLRLHGCPPHQVEADENSVNDAHFVVDQLMQLAALLDYSDEAGRRAMADVTQCVCA